MLSRAYIAGRKMVNAVHIDYARGLYAWMGGVEGVPRLSVAQGKDHTGWFRRWYVDSQAVRDLDVALEVLNGTMTLEEAMKEPEKPVKKFSLAAQIEEVEREIKERERVYPRLAAKNPSEASRLEYQLERMRSIRATLKWLQENEMAIKQRLSY